MRKRPMTEHDRLVYILVDLVKHQREMIKFKV